jgi:hypothetical protein
MKTCTKCIASKSLDEFYRRKDSADGRVSLCKVCQSAQNREWAVNNKDRTVQYSRAWTDRNRATERDRQAKLRESAATKERLKKWHQQNKEAVAAYQKARHNASRDNLSDHYVRVVLRMTADQCPPLLIELKREHLMTSRLTRALKQELDTRLENSHGN